MSNRSPRRLRSLSFWFGGDRYKSARVVVTALARRGLNLWKGTNKWNEIYVFAICLHTRLAQSNPQPRNVNTLRSGRYGMHFTAGKYERIEWLYRISAITCPNHLHKAKQTLAKAYLKEIVCIRLNDIILIMKVWAIFTAICFGSVVFGSLKPGKKMIEGIESTFKTQLSAVPGGLPAYPQCAAHVPSIFNF